MVEGGSEGMTADEPEAGSFDFDDHRRRATDEYKEHVRFFEDCARAVYTVLQTALAARSIPVHSVEWRAKSIESFARKVSRPSDVDPLAPKYSEPLKEITDLAAVRVITFFLETVETVSNLIEEEFEVIEKTNRTSLLQEEERFGYQSIHYLIRFNAKRNALPEYSRFRETIAEVQVRTILQHAWAEIEHDIQYHSVETLPAQIRRRFMSLAGMLEIADREFQAIADEDRRIRTDARRLINAGRLEEVELTPDALKAFLDRTFGPDGRMSDWSYGWTTRLLKHLGFENLRQIRECIGPYDDDAISRARWGSRQGQLSRFEDVLLVSMGRNYIERHPWSRDEWFIRSVGDVLERLEKAGFTIGTCDPRQQRGA
jgi:putative GTP pyrophosphokinase